MATANIETTHAPDATPDKAKWLEGLSYAQHQRLRFFEAKLLWEGQINRQSVCLQFGVTANHFTREVRDYRHYFPNNLWYDVSDRVYRPTEKFQAGVATGQPNEYLALLKIYTHNPSNALLAEMGTTVECEIFAEPQGQVDQNVFRLLLAAIHCQSGCQVMYQSFSSATAQKRTIWPHALAWSGERWHVRAYDSKRHTYLDFALPRITSASAEKSSLPDNADEDKDWLETLNIEVIPNPKLSASQQRVIANEYGMKRKSNGYVWSTTLRRCMIPYFLYRYRLDDLQNTKQTHNLPIPRIIVRDYTIIKKYSFTSKNYNL